MDGKKRKKKDVEPAPGLTRRVAGTMYGVGGREREGKPPNFGLTLAMVSNTGHSGGGFKRYAHPAGPLYYVLEGMTTVTTTTPICWGSNS